MLVVRPHAQGLSYMAPIDRAAWSVEQRPSLCRLRQEIPRLGDAVFESRPGGERFFIASADSPLRSGTAQLAMVAPFWNPARETLPLGPVTVNDGALLVSVEGEAVRQLQAGLTAGLAAELLGAARGEADFEVRVSATPVYFRRAYSEYRSCIEQLPAPPAPKPVPPPRRAAVSAAPVLAADRLAYGEGVWRLSEGQQGLLGRVVAQLQAQPGSRAVIDGFGGDSHRRLLNLELSRKRAQAVSDYLRSRGIGADRIVMRYHGDQEGRRREATVRLEGAPAAQAQREAL